ncbi:hypothetical protein SO802_033334 [Lithocarpus litseifolius]|uniref:DUF4283 domain-containing protein n=1 Tax=Lithocarpus litseifolius TaxID=425828 RepID=A0AAW2BG80_9ROSI
MEDLAEKWSNFSLSDTENTGFWHGPSSNCRGPQRVSRSKIRKIRVLFIFDNLNDVDRILQSQPWSFDKYLVMLQRYDTDVLVCDLVFKKALFWVQVHNIPVRFINTKVAEGICDIVSEVQKSTKVVDDDGGYFIRVRVSIDITLPLCRGRVITMENGTLSPDSQQFNSSLKAAPYTAGGKNVIYVPGFYKRRQPNVNSEPPEVVLNHAPAADSSDQGPVREVHPAAVTKKGVEESNGGEEVDMVTEVTESIEGGKLSESNLEPELLPIKDSISNGLSPIKAPVFVGGDINDAIIFKREMLRS